MNAALRQQLAADAGVEKRVKILDDNRARVEQALERENVSETEPEITARLKAVEYQALEMQKQSKVVKSLDGISAGASFTTVAQRAGGLLILETRHPVASALLGAVHRLIGFLLYLEHRPARMAIHSHANACGKVYAASSSFVSSGWLLMIRSRQGTSTK